jgi:hypothetical protein
MSDLDLPFLQSASFGPVFSQQARIRVIHSTEGPMSRGNARSLAGPNWFGSPKAGTSAHDIFDPSEGVKMVADNRIAWHVGPGGNSFTRGSEHCAYVRYTTAEWLSADGQEMLDRSARYNAAAAHRDGVLPRWLTLTQLARKEPGFCTHNDIRLVFGGTTHSDPGPNFPYDWYMQRVQFYYDGGTDTEWQEIMSAADDIVEALNKVNDNLTGTYRKDTAPNATQEPGSLKGITARLGDVTDRLDKLIAILSPVSPPPVVGKK